MATVKTYWSWETSRAAAIVIVTVVMIVLALASAAARRRGSSYGGLLNGADNRWSTSKVSVFLWTAAILWAFVALLLRYGGSAVPKSVPAAYFALLGIPAGGALGAKAITSGQAAAGGKSALPSPTLNPVKGVGQIFADDTGVTDLLDSQYFLFNLVLLGYFVAGFFHLALPKGTDITLPALPGSLLALAGVSTATYLGKKGLAGGAGAITKIPSGSLVQLADESDVSLPGGGTITLKQAGAVTISAGVTYTSSAAATLESAVGGRLTLTTGGRLSLDPGGSVTGDAATVVRVIKDTKLVVSADSSIAANGNPVPNAGGVGTDVKADTTITFGPHGGKVVVMVADTELELPAAAVVEYAKEGDVVVLQQTLDARLTAGPTLAQKGIDKVVFPEGGSYADAAAGSSLQRAAPGEAVELKAESPNSPARSITLAEDAHVKLPADTVVELPAAPPPLAAGMQTAAVTKTKVSLPSGGDVTIEKGGSALSAHVPAGAIVKVPDGAEAGTATTT